MNRDYSISFDDALRRLAMDENSIGIRFVSKKETERGNPDLYLALSLSVLYSEPQKYWSTTAARNQNMTMLPENLLLHVMNS